MAGAEPCPRRRRAARRARAARLHRQPATRCGAWPRRWPAPASPSSCPACPATAPTSRTCSTRRWPTGRPRPRRRSTGVRGRLGDGGRVVVAGLSMGGTLTAWLATRHRDSPASSASTPSSSRRARWRELVDEAIAAGTEVIPGIGSDIADPDTPRRATRARRCGRSGRCSTPSTSCNPTWADHLPGARPQLARGPRRAAVEQRPPGRRRWPARSSGSPSSAATTSPRSTTTRTIVEERIVDFARSVTRLTGAVVAAPRLRPSCLSA